MGTGGGPDALYSGGSFLVLPEPGSHFRLQATVRTTLSSSFSVIHPDLVLWTHSQGHQSSQQSLIYYSLYVTSEQDPKASLQASSPGIWQVQDLSSHLFGSGGLGVKVWLLRALWALNPRHGYLPCLLPTGSHCGQNGVNPKGGHGRG